MRLHHLALTAFGPFAGTEHIDFDQLAAGGVFLLHGPTGAGKTAVLDAVCYALYGSVPGSRRHQLQALRSDHADPGTPTEVTLDLTVGGRRLRLTRRPEQTRPKKRGTGHTTDKALTLLSEHDPATGHLHPLSRSHQETAHELGRLIGLNRDQFCQIVLLPQGDFARFLRAGAEDRAHLLGRLFDTARFATAEAHLAELRAAAERENRDNDTHLRTLVQRLRQAAGPAAPPPPSDSDDAEPATYALTHAAQARTTARELHDQAAVALATAEDAHHRLQEHLAEVTDRARLQQRHAEAQRRTAELTADADRVADTVHLLDRARAADAVAPALALRDAATHERDTTQATEAAARAALPTRLTEAAAERLATEEHAVRQELGTLDAARRAEERAAHLTDELRRLDAEDHADRELLATVEDRAAETDASRATLQDRVTAARDAAARADTLTTRLDTAEHRLAAARHAGTLTARLHTLDQRLLTDRENAATAYEHWLDLRERRLRGVAADLAAALHTGAPCPVCGSTDHPEPARPDGQHIDHAAEEAARAAHQRAEERRGDTEQQRAAAAADLAAATAQSDDRDPGSLLAEVDSLRADRDAARAHAADATAARDALAAAETRHTALRHEAAGLRERLAARSSRRDALRAERDTLHASGGTATTGGTAERAAALVDLADRLGVAAEAARTAHAAAERGKNADARAADAAHHAGFTSPEEAAGAVLPPERQHALQRRVDTHRAELAAARAQLADSHVALAAERPRADPAAARATAEEALHRLRRATAAETAARTRCAELDALSEELAEAVRHQAPHQARRRRVSRLAHLTAGTAAENLYRMRLETYVLAARLEQVAAAATHRLHRMTSGRYALSHTDSRNGRARSGLGLRVTDAWTGTDRDTATLSGGESFIVSLALALGLADTVTADAGGSRLDTLFIDEGFGTLDEQSLDDVLEVLDALRAHDRTVGIVSHVTELRARVPVRLEVVRRRAGSAVRHHTVPLTP